MKNVLITGASGGLGKSLVCKFASEGYHIFAHARQANELFERNLNVVSKRYDVPIQAVYFDLLDRDAMKREISSLYRSQEMIDVLVNNAGIAHGGLFRMTSIKEIRKIFDINLFSVMELTQMTARGMERKKSGSIINIASISGVDLSIGNCAYGTSKAALMAFTKTLAAEYTPLGIRVNAVAPGLLNTKMAKQMEENAYNDMVNRSFMNRLGEVEEVAEVVSFLASDKASFVSGQVICVDGGRK